MGYIVFNNGIYKSKSKEESDMLLASLNNGLLYREESAKEIEKKFNKRINKKKNGK